MSKKNIKENDIELVEEELVEEEKEEKSKGPPKNIGKNIENLLEESIELSKKVFEQNKKIKRKLNWIIFGGYIKLLFIIVPIIFGIIFLPPIIKDLLSQYQSLLGIGSAGVLPDIISNITGSSSGGQININDIISNLPKEQINSLLKSIK